MSPCELEEENSLMLFSNSVKLDVHFFLIVFLFVKDMN